jgi:hypothetical protein
LAIADTDYDFATYPVIKLEFAKDRFDTVDNFERYINNVINRIAKRYGIELIEDTSNQKFDDLVIKLHEKIGQKVVVLIDEYDKPFLNNLKKSVLGEIKEATSAFYGVVKSLDEHLRFVFITGVSKFAKVSIFSGMNSLDDIPLDEDYARYVVLLNRS